MPSGTVKFFNIEKGFGFITIDGEDSDIYVNIKKLNESGINSILKGQSVEFELLNSNGRVQAQKISIKNSPIVNTDSPLVAKAANLHKIQRDDEYTLGIWGKVVSYVQTGNGGALVRLECLQGERPRFWGNWAKLKSWCSLIGLAPAWTTSESYKGRGEPRVIVWILGLESCSLPDDQEKVKIITRYGRPPGY